MKRALVISAITGVAIVLFYVWLAFWGDGPQGREMFDEAETDARPLIPVPSPDYPPEPPPATVPVKKAQPGIDISAAPPGLGPSQSRASKKGVIPHNPARDAEPPRIEKKERVTLKTEDLPLLRGGYR